MWLAAAAGFCLAATAAGARSAGAAQPPEAGRKARQARPAQRGPAKSGTGKPGQSKPGPAKARKGRPRKASSPKPAEPSKPAAAEFEDEEETPSLESIPAGPGEELPGIPSPGDGGTPAQPPRPAQRYWYTPPLSWKGPFDVPGGFSYKEPKDRASISIAFHPEATPDWKPPDRYRQHMSELGTTEDSHVLDVVKLAGRLGSRCRYTTYIYEGEAVGAAAEVLYTERLMFPDNEGIYVLVYEARKRQFDRFRPGWLAFLKTITLPQATGLDLEPYYGKRLESAVEAAAAGEPRAVDPSWRPPRLGPRKFQAGLDLGLAKVVYPGDLKPYMSPGPAGSLQFLYRPMKWLAAGTELGLAKFPGKTKRFTPQELGIDPGGLQYTFDFKVRFQAVTWLVLARLDLLPESAITPYLLAGGGWHWSKGDFEVEINPRQFQVGGFTVELAPAYARQVASSSFNGLALTAGFGISGTADNGFGASIEGRVMELRDKTSSSDPLRTGRAGLGLHYGF